MFKTTYPILCFLISSSAYSGIDSAYYAKPYDYSIDTKSPYDSAIDGWQRGTQMAQQAQNAKQQRELHQARMAQLKREDEYRAELRKFYDDPASLTNDNLMKLMIIYPEFNENTQKLKESLDKLKIN